MFKMGLKNKLSTLRDGYVDCSQRTFFSANEFHKLAEGRVLGKFLKAFGVDCVIDVGANRGQYASALRMNAGYKGHIISVEPLPEAFDELTRVASADPLWHFENCALSDFGGIQDFHVMEGEQFSSFLCPTVEEYSGLDERNSITEMISVKTVTLDDFFDRWRDKLQFKRPFLKLDTQGYDHVVLASGTNSLPLMTGVQSEIAFKRLYRNSLAFDEMLAFLDQKGFTISAIFPNNDGHFPHCIEQDAVFFNRAFESIVEFRG